MFSSQLHYKIEQKNHSPSNFAWVSKDKVGWHGVGENELNIRLNKEKKKRNRNEEGVLWEHHSYSRQKKVVRRRLSAQLLINITPAWH